MSSNGGGAIVQLTIPARAEYITLCRLALTEATSNSVRHAYVDDGDGVVEISYELLADRLVIEVTDEGAGFDPAETEGPPEDLSEGGLGIAIIRAIADEVEIKTRPGGKGSQLRFEKALD